MLKNKKSNKQYKAIGGSRSVLGNFSYMSLIFLFSSLIFFQSCELSSMPNEFDDLNENQLEELEKEIGESGQNDDSDGQEGEDSSNTDNPMFTIMDTSLISENVNIEINFEDLTSIIYSLENNGEMELNFIEVLGKKGVRISQKQESHNCYISIDETIQLFCH